MTSAQQRDVPAVFMFGFERSGTTLLSMMVGAHPRIAVPLSLTGLWYRYAKEMSRYGNLQSSADVERLVDDLLGEERIKMWDVTLERAELLQGLEPGSYAAVIARFHALYARAKGKDLWGNIDIDTIDEMDIANGWFPEAKFVHIVRDGRDVALSHEGYAYGASNIGECADKWLRSVKMNLKMGAILGPQRYMILHYEDLIRSPEVTLRKLCDFVGVSYAPEMLQYARMVQEKVPVDRRWIWPILDRPPDVSRVERWKRQMSATQRIVFERAAAGLLRELGYETYATIPRQLTAFALELWYFLGQGGRFQRLGRALRIRNRSPRKPSGSKRASTTPAHPEL